MKIAKILQQCILHPNSQGKKIEKSTFLKHALLLFSQNYTTKFQSLKKIYFLEKKRPGIGGDLKSRGSPSDSTCILEAKPGKLDIHLSVYSLVQN